jgi:hypothetical protein
MGIEVARPDPRRHPIAMHTHGPPSRRAPLEGDWTKWRAHDHGQCQWEHATYRERERGTIRPLDQQRCVGLSRICAQTMFYAMG